MGYFRKYFFKVILTTVVKKGYKTRYIKLMCLEITLFRESHKLVFFWKKSEYYCPIKTFVWQKRIHICKTDPYNYSNIIVLYLISGIRAKHVEYGHRHIGDEAQVVYSMRMLDEIIKLVANIYIYICYYSYNTNHE